MGLDKTIDWSEIREDDVVLGKDGHPWAVHRIDAEGVILKRQHDQKAFRGKPSGPVVLVSRGVDMAVAQLTVRAGAIEIGKKDRQERWLQPVEYDHPAAILAHLLIFHGHHGEHPDLAGLIAEHKAAHDPSAKVGDLYVPHTHDPAYADA